ncbi:CU044_5270 family protein [Streptacidiphilus sp. N1-3]|uniref:CU044_5270 family protein n=1 Tax=Streptacidiphilus alkalitolerans TaxID=3342712 RepID=A0ABV6XEM2_9ACTN
MTARQNQPGPEDREELARLLPAPGDPELSRDRHLLLKDHLMREIKPGAVPAPRRPVRRLLITAGSLSAAAALVAVVAVEGRPGTAAPQAAAPPAPTSAVSVDPGSHQQAVVLLGRIAEAASTQKLLPFRNDQYAYIRSEVGGGSGTAPETREIWRSIDGSKRTVIKQKSLGGTITESSPDGPGTMELPTPAFLATLPTDPQKLHDMLAAATKGTGTGPAAVQFKTVFDLLGEQIVTPQVGAALYRSIALIPGVVTVPDAVDALGRHGVAVALTDPASGVREEYVFNRSTLAYLGSSDVQTDAPVTRPTPTDLPSGRTVDAQPRPAAGTVLYSTAVVARAVVDRPGQTH